MAANDKHVPPKHAQRAHPHHADVPVSDAITQEYLRWAVQNVQSFTYLGQVPEAKLFRTLAVLSPEHMAYLFGTGGAAFTLPHAAENANALTPKRRALIHYALGVVRKRTMNAALSASASAPNASLPNNAARIFALEYLERSVFPQEAPLELSEDVTGHLPKPAHVTPAVLTAGDYAAAAQKLGVDVAAIKAVAHVESSGAGFGPGGRPVIRYELHRFQSKTHSTFHATHPHLSQPTLAAGERYHVGLQSREYSMLHGAMLLKKTAKFQVHEAIASASWGKFQIMGENSAALGWASPLQFALDMHKSEAHHLDAFLKFVKSSGLVSALKNHDWATFAAGYNGAGYAVNHYDTNLAKAYKQFSS